MTKYEGQGRMIGRDLYADLDSEYRAVINVGMTHVELVNMFTEELKNKFAKAAAKKLFGEENPDNELMDKLKAAIKHEIIVEYQRGFCIGLMEAAEKEGRLMA